MQVRRLNCVRGIGREKGMYEMEKHWGEKGGSAGEGEGGDFLFFRVASIVAFLKRLWSRTQSKLDAVAGLLKSLFI